MFKYLLPLVLLLLTTAKASADNEQVCVITNTGSTGEACSGSELGSLDPCDVPLFRVKYTIPSGYVAPSKFEWYVDGVLTFTGTTPTNPTYSFALKKKNTTVFVDVTYQALNGTLSSTYRSTSFTANVKSISFTEITGDLSPIAGCSNQANYSIATFNCSVCYNPPPNTYTVTWQPPTGWVQTGSSNNGRNVSFIPSSVDAGTLTAKITINSCGYEDTRTVAVTRSSPAPSFSSSDPTTICGTTPRININGVCGASSYTYTITSTTSGSYFTSSGSQSLTSTNNFADLTVIGSGYTFSINVQANFPNGTSSAVVSKQFVAGGFAYGNFYFTSNYNTGSSALGPNNPKFLPAGQLGSWTVYINNPDLTNVTWANTGGYPVGFGTNGSTLNFSMTAASGAYTTRSTTFTLTATGPCGSFSQSFNFSIVTQGWGGRMVVSPNPAKNRVIIEIQQTPLGSLKRGLQDNVIVNLYEFHSSRIVRQWNFASGNKQYSLDVSGLSRGQYVVETVVGQIRETKHLLLE